ncbi:type II/IV secretion system ATPase subunit [Methanoplanus sp. FWC-SCC4]|uniref:Type II/IV secretion system ATPase subunit n=1 Tax=Methanochimaera problematica TaxID=2609417 RepID=A0AA97FCC8_9EURY|nr:type II/IV secretion system ATPase subunit [Methanoplanus sp. FWC-SCC4]WOF15619.1 type II/IV secretion system ATPase subunit [Methanoplanus sp. FWC-SCC4]
MGSLSANINLPFQPEELDEEDDIYSNYESSALYRMLPANAKEYVAHSPHLLEYLQMFPVNIHGIPLFFSELKRELKGLENPNVIYPVNEFTFIHIFSDPEDVRNYYIPIEPSFMHSVSDAMPLIEKKLIDLIDVLEEDPITEEERREVLKRVLKEVIYIKKPDENIAMLTGEAETGKTGFKDKIVKFLNTDFTAQKETGELAGSKISQTPDGKVILSMAEYRSIEYLLIRDKIEMGILNPFLADTYNEDITCDGVGPIFVEHKIFKGLKSAVEFKYSEEIDEFVIKMAERIKRPITYKNPIVDATLPDGSRINIVYGTEISKHGSNFTIRKFAEDPPSILALIEWKTTDYMVAGYLWICIEFGMSLFMSGETASGKTTSLNALTSFIAPESKIVTIEDTPELQVPHKNWTRQVSKGKGKGEGDGGDITMFDLLRAALRQRPNYILVGEIRGSEGAVAFGAMQTGHPVMSTFHAASVEKLIQRLCSDPINIPMTHVDNLNLVIIQSAVRRPDGSTVRRMLSINELVGYDPETGGFSFVSMFVWNPVTDEFDFPGKGSSYLLENKIGTLLGIPDNKKSEMYFEVEKRAKILQRLHKAGYMGFWDLYHMMTKVKKQGLLKIEF